MHPTALTKETYFSQSVLSDRCESSEKKKRRAFSLALHILQYHSLFYRDNNYEKEKRKNKIQKEKKNPVSVDLRVKRISAT